MKRAISTYLFRHCVLGVHVLDQIARAGIEQVEIYCERPHFDYANPNHVREIAGWFSDSAVRLHSVHAPLSRDPVETSHHGVVSIAFLDRQRRQDSMDEIKRALELAELVPFRYLVIHLGIPGEEYDLRKFDAALTSLEHLRLFAGQRGVEILIENIPNDLSTPSRLVEFIHHTRLHDLKVCFDSGHAQLDGQARDGLRLIKGAVACAHLHDNDGALDDHRAPFEGVIPWPEFAADLAREAPEALWLLEVRGKDGPEPGLEPLAQVFARLERIRQETA